MEFLRQLRERRVPQYVSAYVVGAWGLVQFATFLEGRLMLSPHLVNALAIGLILFLPSAVILAWCHGRPGADKWGRLERVSIPVNLIAAVVLVGAMFADKDLGAVTQTVEVKDENGTVMERVVPKSEYRRRAFVSYLENRGNSADDWLRQGLATALVADLNQDPFVDVEYPPTRMAALRREGHPTGLDVPRPLMRQIAREAHFSHLVTGWFEQTADALVIELEIHDTDSGRLEGTLTRTGSDLFRLIDEISVEVRREIGVPAGHMEEQADLPVADLSTDDPGALKSFVLGSGQAIHGNDWDGAGLLLEDAVERDPSFALAYFMLYVVRLTNGDEPGANRAMAQAMENLYRLSERSQFQVKAVYYYNVKQDPDKAMAVAQMWTRLYPNDVAAYQQVAQFAQLRGDSDAAAEALATILEIDSAQHHVLIQLANHYQELGDLDQARTYLERYAELNPTEVRSFTQLSDLYLAFGKLVEARSALEQAQLIMPDRPETLRKLAEIDGKLGRFAEAETALDSLLKTADNDEDRLAVLDDLMKLARTRGRWRQARALLDDWNELALTMMSPSQVWLTHGLRLLRITTPEQANAAYQEIRSLRPRIGSPNDQIMGMCEASVLALAGRIDEAQAAMAETEKFIEDYKLEMLRPRVMTISGWVAEANGDLDTARQIHARGLQLDPINTLHMRRLGRLGRLTGHFDEAHEALTEALEHNPGHPEANLEMAQLLAETGRPVEARKHLDRALAGWDEAVPGHPGAAEARELDERLDALP